MNMSRTGRMRTIGPSREPTCDPSSASPRAATGVSARDSARDPWAFPAPQRPLPLPIQEQLPLDLPGPARTRPSEPVETDANRMALRLLATPSLWPCGVVCLAGPRGSGKTLVLRARFAQALQLTPEDFAESALRDDLVAAGRTLVFEDLDRALAARVGATRRALESALFHLLNMVNDRGAMLVLSSRTPPAWWPVDLPDLRTRLAAIPLARIEAPDDAHLAAALRDRFAERGAVIDDRTLDYLITRMERSFDAVERVVARIDALARREQARIDPRLAARALRWSAATS